MQKLGLMLALNAIDGAMYQASGGGETETSYRQLLDRAEDRMRFTSWQAATIKGQECIQDTYFSTPPRPLFSRSMRFSYCYLHFFLSASPLLLVSSL